MENIYDFDRLSVWIIIFVIKLWVKLTCIIEVIIKCFLLNWTYKIKQYFKVHFNDFIPFQMWKSFINITEICRIISFIENDFNRFYHSIPVTHKRNSTHFNCKRLKNILLKLQKVWKLYILPKISTFCMKKDTEFHKILEYILFCRRKVLEVLFDTYFHDTNFYFWYKMLNMTSLRPHALSLL